MNRSSSLCCFLLISAVALLLIGCAPSYSNHSINHRVIGVAEAIAAQDGTVIRVRPPVQQLNVADIAVIEINIDNVTNLVAAEIQLQFDPNILQARDADPIKDGIQIQPGSFLAPDFVISDEVNNETGVARYALAQLAPTAPANGSGLLASITFQAVGEGSSQLTFTLAQFATGEGQEISVIAQPGQVIVGQVVASPTTTFTPTTEPDQSTATPTSEPDVDLPTSTSTLLPETATPDEPTFTPVSATSTLAPPPLPPTNTPVPPASSIPPGATVGFCYRVQAGDTLHSLGQKFGINPHYINVVNDLHPPGQIVVYQILFIPQQYGYGPNVYIVEPGDTLANIAERCRLPVTFLASVNNLDETFFVQHGRVLKIPIPPFPPPSRFSYPLPKLRPIPVPSTFCDYVVQPGDTLYSLGQRYGISPDVLARANNLDNPHYLYVGQCLTLIGYGAK